ATRDATARDPVDTVFHLALRDPAPAVRLFAARHTRGGNREGTVRELTSCNDDDVASEAISMLFDVLAGPDAETLLLDLADRASPWVRIAAIDRLGLHGTVRAVERLLEVANRSSRVANPGLVEAAERAIAAIQARIEGAEKGQLALTGPDTAGALS